MMRIASCAACSLLLTAAALAQDPQDKAARLKELRAQIEQVKEALSEDRAREDELTRELRRLEERIGRLNADLDDVEQRLRTKSARVDELREDYAAASERLATQRRFLRQQLRAAYMQGQEAYLQLLLDQEDPEAVDRMMVYYDYFNDARSERIRSAVEDLAELRELRDSLDAELAELDQLREKRSQSLEQLRAQRSERKQLLTRLRERIGERDDRLTRLQADAEQLSNLVAGLRGNLSDIPKDQAAQRAFSSRKGELGWPLVGDVLGDYGSRRAEGITWNGLLIDADAGEPVRAVAHGRVVFADWLRGLGLLIIIDHGDGYMTLYGHNQSLYSEAGDWVSAGDVVATVGASGGREKAALYFELRSKGQPIDPTAWLQSPSPAG
jgi:septal ring factor EnvC (AmiA/AmiB activator)